MGHECSCTFLVSLEPSPTLESQDIKTSRFQCWGSREGKGKRENRQLSTLSLRLPFSFPFSSPQFTLPLSCPFGNRPSFLCLTVDIPKTNKTMKGVPVPLTLMELFSIQKGIIQIKEKQLHQKRESVRSGVFSRLESTLVKGGKVPTDAFTSVDYKRKYPSWESMGITQPLEKKER